MQIPQQPTHNVVPPTSVEVSRLNAAQKAVESAQAAVAAAEQAYNAATSNLAAARFEALEAGQALADLEAK
jgi:hypothetical protein